MIRQVVKIYNVLWASGMYVDWDTPVKFPEHKKIKVT